MKEENEQKLYSDFPELYAGMEYGFQCGDGWYKVLYKASANIVQAAKALSMPVPRVVQVTNKFGSLRIYFSGAFGPLGEAVRKETAKANEEAEQTCEACGKPAVGRQDGYISPRCVEHMGNSDFEDEE